MNVKLMDNIRVTVSEVCTVKEDISKMLTENPSGDFNLITVFPYELREKAEHLIAYSYELICQSNIPSPFSRDNDCEDYVPSPYVNSEIDAKERYYREQLTRGPQDVLVMLEARRSLLLTSLRVLYGRE